MATRKKLILFGHNGNSFEQRQVARIYGTARFRPLRVFTETLLLTSSLVCFAGVPDKRGRQEDCRARMRKLSVCSCPLFHAQMLQLKSILIVSSRCHHFSSRSLGESLTVLLSCFLCCSRPVSVKLARPVKMRLMQLFTRALRKQV